MNKMFSLIAATALTTLTFTATAQDAQKGKTLYNTCIECHGEDGLGKREKNAPKLSGQFDWYVIKQVNDFKTGVRKNPDMDPYIKNLSEQDIKDLAAYILTL